MYQLKEKLDVNINYIRY